MVWSSQRCLESVEWNRIGVNFLKSWCECDTRLSLVSLLQSAMCKHNVDLCMYVYMYVCMYVCMCVGPGGEVVWVLGS